MEVLKDSRGMTTVFLAIIFSAFVLLGMLLIDAARIMLAQRQLQSALDTAARSSLALCHEGLAAEFGLYGTALQKDELERYLRANLREHQEAVNFVKYEGLSVEVKTNATDSLLNKENFREQVLQYMKYKAPLVFGENILSKFMDFDFNNQMEVMESGQQAVSLRIELKKECAEINSCIKNFNITISGMTNEAESELLDDALVSLEIIRDNIDHRVIPAINAYEAAVDELNKKDGCRNTNSLQESETIRGWAKNTQNRIMSHADILHSIKHIQDEVRRIREDSFLSEAVKKNRIRQLESKTAWLLASLKDMEELILVVPSEKPRVEINNNEDRTILDYLNNSLPFKILPAEDFIDTGEFIRGNDITRAAGFSETDKEMFREIQEEFAKEQGGKIIAFLSSLHEKFVELALRGRDNVYQTEYIMDKYTYLTSGTLRDHYFNKGEVEYILCGSSSELANLLVVYENIFFFRYAVNVMDIFVRSPIGDPYGRLADALVRGFAEACLEVVQLYNGKEVAFFPDLPQLKMKYSDYLRVFLLMQDSEMQLNRMRQLIQVNIKEMQKEDKFELAELYSTGRIQAGVEIQLWFLPARPFQKLGFKYFQNGRYRIVKEAVFAY